MFLYLNNSLSLDYSKTLLPESTDINTFLQTILERFYPNEVELVSTTSVSDWYCGDYTGDIIKTLERVRFNISYMNPMICLNKLDLPQGTKIKVYGKVFKKGLTTSVVLVAANSTIVDDCIELTRKPWYNTSTETQYSIEFIVPTDMKDVMLYFLTMRDIFVKLK